MAATLAESLAPIAKSLQARRPIVRPISQVVLQLSGERAFEDAIKHTVAWIARRVRTRLPEGAFAGAPFDTTGILGAQPAQATRIDGDGARVWAAKLDDDDRNTAQRVWTTELSVGQKRDVVRFGARLTQITGGEDASFNPTVPGVIRQLAAKIDTQVDGRRLMERPWVVDDDSQYEAFDTLLLQNSRRLPIVALSRSDDGLETLDPELLARNLCGAAHVVVLSPDASWQLTESYGKAFSVFNGAIRLYRPGFDPYTGNPYEHDLVLAEHVMDREQVASDLARHVLALTFSGKDPSALALRFEDVRRIATEREQERAYESGASASEQLAQAIKEVARLKEQLAVERDAAQQLLDEAAARQLRAEEERNEARADTLRIRSRLTHLEEALKGRETPEEPLDDYKDIEQWSEKNLSGSVVILNRAFRETKKSTFEDTRLFGNTLLFVRDYYVKMRRGQISRQEFEEKARELGVEETACFAQAGSIKNFPEYRVPYKQKSVWLERHFKYGGGYNQRDMFRIYFAWDEEDQVVVIGHMPTHLDNWNTN